MNELNKRNSRWYRNKIIYYGFVSTALIVFVTAFPFWVTDILVNERGISELVLSLPLTLVMVLILSIPVFLYGWSWGIYVRKSLGDGKFVSTVHEWAMVGGGIAILVTTALHFSIYAYQVWRMFFRGEDHEGPAQYLGFGIGFAPPFHLGSALIGLAMGALLGHIYGRWRTRTGLVFLIAIGLFLGTGAVVAFDYWLINSMF